VPNPLKVPAPPEPKLPAPPEPAAWVNAFTPPPKQDKEQQMMQNMMSQQMGGQPMMNPYMMAQGMPGYGYAPRQPMLVMGNQRQPLNYMANYQGPGAPNPFAPQQPVMPAQYQQPMTPMQQPMAPTQYQQPMPGGFPAYIAPSPMLQAPAGQVNEAIYLQQLTSVLRESPYPAQREWAATTLAAYDWRMHPEVVNLLIAAARQDPAPTVRAGCVYSLARMNANLEPVATTFETLRQDADPRVRQEAEQALVRFSSKQ
jgi:hypothetical protein